MVKRTPLDQIELDYPGPVRYRLSLTRELAELIDLLAWLQIDSPQGVIRQAVAEWVVVQLQAYADLESTTVDDLIELYLAKRHFAAASKRGGDARR